MTEPRQDMRTQEQNDLLQPACRDLSQQLQWKTCDGGFRWMSADEWRWMICGCIQGQVPVPGIHGGIVFLGGSSKKLSKERASDAITTAFHIGDCPWEYDLKDQARVKWCDVIRLARGITDEELQT